MIDSTVEFVAVPGHTAYRLSRCGRLQTCLRKVSKTAYARTDRWKDMKWTRNRAGYLVTMLTRDEGGRTYVFLHVLLMRVFVGPCPEGLEVCHRDDNKANNSLDNLYYGTRSQNVRDALRNGGKKSGERHKAALLSDDHVREIRSRTAAGLRDGDQTRMAREFGVHISTINGIVKGRTRKWVS